MKNQKGGVVWLFISFVCANIIAFSTRCRYYGYYGNKYTLLDRGTLRFFENEVLYVYDLDAWIPSLSILAFMLLFCSLFIRKHGQSAWSQLQKRTDDNLYIAYTIIIVFMAVVTPMNWICR